MATTQVSLFQPAPSVKNWRILLDQCFTGRMPLLTTMAHSDYEEDARVLRNIVTPFLCRRLFNIIIVIILNNC